MKAWDEVLLGFSTGIMCTLYVIICVMICKYELSTQRKSTRGKRKIGREAFYETFDVEPMGFMASSTTEKSGFINFIQFSIKLSTNSDIFLTRSK